MPVHNEKIKIESKKVCFPCSQAIQNLRHGSNSGNNEAQVSTTDSDTNRHDSGQPPTT